MDGMFYFVRGEMEKWMGIEMDEVETGKRGMNG